MGLVSAFFFFFFLLTWRVSDRDYICFYRGNKTILFSTNARHKCVTAHPTSAESTILFPLFSTSYVQLKLCLPFFRAISNASRSVEVKPLLHSVTWLSVCPQKKKGLSLDSRSSDLRNRLVIEQSLDSQQLDAIWWRGLRVKLQKNQGGRTLT